ncbi:MAG TPA: hypothetical protein VGY97_08035 [Solirubrobacteraceae bacterium]|nr:hypothetical protein [Solirubrobacteraceae bacterium]
MPSTIADARDTTSTGSHGANATASHATNLAGYVSRLNAIFEAAATKHDAHRSAASIMAEAARDPSFLAASLAHHLEAPDALSRTHYPVLAMELESNPLYELVVNCWIPLPGGDTDLSTKAIHHHGELLLTTATAFGPGYGHWLLSQPRLVDRDAGIYATDLIERGVHGLGEVAFVDAYVAHLPMYPASLTVTICLWSSRSQRTWKDSLKHLRIVSRHRETLRAVAVRTGLARRLDVTVADTFDFYPVESGFAAIREREEFPRGPNEDYLQSLFHIVQATGNGDLAAVIERRLEREGSPANRELIRELLDRLREGVSIPACLSPGQYDVPTANFHVTDIERALAAAS